MWPEMDSDALPSSYLLKVFAALEKWDVKLSSIVEAVQDETTDKSVLCFGYGCYVTCPPKLSSDLCPIGASSTCLLLCVLPRLKSKAKEMSTALQNISAELEKIQTAGLAAGYTELLLSLIGSELRTPTLGRPSYVNTTCYNSDIYPTSRIHMLSA